jgi:predicted enzyme involved in methoxymalonyl-ACP biosynthesis
MYPKERSSSPLEQLLDRVRKNPTYLNYWNAYKQIRKLDLDSHHVPDGKKIKVALLSSFTIDPLGIYLEIKCRLAHLHPEIYVAPFNQYNQEILDGNSELYMFKPEVIILASNRDN